MRAVQCPFGYVSVWCNAACARLVAPQHGRLLDYGDLTREDAASVFARVQHGEALLSLSTAALASTAVAIDAEIGRTVLVAADSNRSMHPSEAAGSKAVGDRASSAATVADQVYASTDGTGAAVAPDESRHSALRRNPATEVLLVLALLRQVLQPCPLTVSPRNNTTQHNTQMSYAEFLEALAAVTMYVDANPFLHLADRLEAVLKRLFMQLSQLPTWATARQRSQPEPLVTPSLLSIL